MVKEAATLEIEEAAVKDEKTVNAQASSAHARINVPLNLENWKSLPEEVQQTMLWFHQHLLDRRMNWVDAEEASGFDRSTIFRALKGTYEGSWKNICAAIRSYQRLDEERGSIQQNAFVENSISRLVWGALDYACANNSMTTIIGGSRQGKTISLLAWRAEHNHGRSVYVPVPAYGGTRLFVRRIAETVGVNRNQGIVLIMEALTRSFNKNRILIIDEAHRLLPGSGRGNPVSLEVVRDLHDQTGCAVALVATQRFDDELRKSLYQYEQVLGRIGMPVRLPRTIRTADILPIIEQYLKNPSDQVIESCYQIANEMGRLGILVETWKMASRIASKAREKLNESHFEKAMAIRKKMKGEMLYSKAGLN
ncbi:MAG: ATP-binding protein [Lentisphaerae bacterium]|nr:ATP-binding protein [Lentisphaerota bacterium]